MGHDKIRFTSGQFAKLHGVNKRTLHYYDEIGLFSPAQKGENGYRYYTYLQSPTLEMILTWRELGMSIEEIVQYMTHRSANAFSSIIEAKTAEIDYTIARLKKIRTRLDKKQQAIFLCTEHDLTQIDVVKCKEDYLLLSQCAAGDYGDNDIAGLIEHAQTMQNHRLFSDSYGTMILVEKVFAEDFEQYDYFFTKTEKKDGAVGLYTKPAGNYVRAFCKGNWDKLPHTYKRIIEFAKDNNLKLSGYAFEEGINEMTINDMDEYITQIMISCD